MIKRVSTWLLVGYIGAFLVARLLSHPDALYDRQYGEFVTVYVFIDPKHTASAGKGKPSQVVGWRRGGEKILHFLFYPLILIELKSLRVMHGFEYLDAQSLDPNRFSLSTQ